MKRLSVIIVTYHSEGDIYDCLSSVWTNCDLPREDVEVIVVDNSPESDGMFGRLRGLYGDEVVLIHNTHNGGYGQGNNVGIRRATAPVVMIMNPDVRMVEPVFKTAVEAFETDSQLCLYGLKQKLSETQLSMSSFACTRTMNGYAYTLLDGICNRFNLFLPSLMYLQGSCFFLSKEKFEAVGMFDEDNFMYGEEDDITFRLRKHFGNHVKFNPHLHYLHLAFKRPPNLDYEKRMLEANIRLNGKNGCPPSKTIKEKLHNIRIRLWRERLKTLTGRGRNEPLCDMLKQFKTYLTGRLKANHENTVFYINPMSYRNSALYDYNLLSSLPEDLNITFFGNSQYDADTIPLVTFRPLFHYQLRKTKVGKALSYAWSLARVAASCLRHKPRIVHIQWTKFPWLDTLFLKAITRRHIRVVYTAHNVLPHADLGQKQKDTYRRYYQLLTHIIVHATATKQELVTQFDIDAHKVSVVPHGLIKIDHNPETVASLAKEWRDKLHGKIVFSTLGFQKSYKGVHLLTRLWSEEPLIKNNPDIHLIIAGKQFAPVDTTPLEGQEGVTIINRYIDDNEYMALSAITDVMLMPYLAISQSGVLISAINEHIPILVSDVGGLTDPLAIAPIGWNIGAPTCDNLRKAILDIVSHPDTINAIKHNDEAWQRLADAYSWKQIGKTTSTIYKEL